jgi:hypothetical protein
MPTELENFVDQEQDVDPSYVPEVEDQATPATEQLVEETPAQES